MGLLAGMGAICTCSFGAVPCPITVNSQQSVFTSNMIAATIFDNTPANIATFGMCSSMANPAVSTATTAALGVLTPQPCTPMIQTNWVMGSNRVLIENKPALLTSDPSCQKFYYICSLFNVYVGWYDTNNTTSAADCTRGDVNNGIYKTFYYMARILFESIYAKHCIR